MRVELITLMSILLLTGNQVMVPSSTGGSNASNAAVLSSTEISSVHQLATFVAETIRPVVRPRESDAVKIQPTPEVQPTPVIQAGPVPVLMYHELGEGPNELYLAVADFEAQLDYLKSAGYHTVTLRQLYDHRINGKPLPEKPIVLTFDDGYISAYTEALPRLLERKMTATLFIESGHVGWYHRMDWDQLKKMVEAGFEIGSHTQSHPDLRLHSKNGEMLLEEIKGSKSTLEEMLKTTVVSFCYPSGRYDATTLAAVKEAGYLAAVTTQYGMVAVDDDPYLWHRIRVNRSDRVDGFRNKLGPHP